MENKEVYKIEKGVSEVTIIHKNGLDASQPVPVKINGNIDSVYNWLEKRSGTFAGSVVITESHILIDRAKMTIELVLNETDGLMKGSVSGKLISHPDFVKWKINTGESWDHKTLSDFVKMNRSCFSDKAIAMKLSSELANIKIKAENEIEKANDNKGNTRFLIVQKVIESNVPANFKLDIPVFKGHEKVCIEVEVWVSNSNFGVTLVSPEANDIISDVRDNIINEQKELIKDLTPGLAIIEQ